MVTHTPRGIFPARRRYRERMTKQLQIGDSAPDFSLATGDGRTVSLGDLRGRRIVLFVYPAALTPGCTKEACDFRDVHDRLLAAGYVVLGLSPDRREKLSKFATDHHLPFPLLSDPDHHVLTAYGTWGEKTMYGRTSIGVLRSTFVIDEQGVLTTVMYGHKASGHVARLLRNIGIA